MTGTDSFTLIMRESVDPASAPNKPPLPPRGHAQWEAEGLLIDRNVESVRVRAQHGAVVRVHGVRHEHGFAAGRVNRHDDTFGKRGRPIIDRCVGKIHPGE